MNPQPAMRPPIASAEAEANLISGVLIDARQGLAVAQTARVTSASFTTPANQTIWAEVLAMTATGAHVDASTFAERMKTRGGEIGGWPAYYELTSKQPTTAQLGFYAAEVASLHRRREVVRHAAAMVEAAHTSPEDLPGISSRLSAALAGFAEKPEPLWPEVVAEAVKRAELVIARDPAAFAGCLSWPWPVAERRFHPIAKGELVVIAARPSVGKSSLARAVCLFSAQAGKEVLFGTLEDSPHSVATQSAAAISGVCYTGLADAHHAEQAEFLVALSGLAMPNFHVFSRDNTMAAISARARAIHSLRPLDLIAIDQLSHVGDSEPSGKENKATAVGRVTRAAKQLAVELQLPVLLMVQLNRESAKTGEEPKLHHLRDSGEIEQDADRVIFLHRPDVDPITGANQAASEDADDRPVFFVNAIQAKGRSVGAGQVVSFYFKRKTASFSPASRNSTN